MAYTDSPIVDRFSTNEERSELCVRAFLNQGAGFIARREVPDKGCDLDIELILAGDRSSSWKFPVQIKSIESLRLVDNEKAISLPFETSRLGYLMRRIPAMGIIIFYAVQDDTCYYEFADRIYNALCEDRGTEDWKGNDKVNIRIPLANVLDAAAAKVIHEVMRQRFEQAAIMQSSQGEKYGLPTVGLVDNFQFDFRNLDHVKRFLREYGLLLLHNYDLDRIQRLITRLPNQEIYRDKDLLLMAAVSYAEAGQYTESQLFGKKLDKFELSPSETLLLRFVALKNQHALGYLSEEAMTKALEALKLHDTDELNRITIEVNLLHYQLTQLKAFTVIPADILQRIESVFAAVESSEGHERTKALLAIWNSENLSYLTSTMASSKFGDVRIRESLGVDVPLEERRRAAEELVRLETLFHEKVSAVRKAASERNDELIKAYATALDVKHYIHHQINYVAFETGIHEHPGFAARLASKIHLASSAFNEFLELGMEKEAYENLCNMLELIELGQGYRLNTAFDKTDLYRVKQQMEAALEIAVRPILFPGLLDNKRNQKEETGGGDWKVLAGLSDEQIQSLARTTLLGLHLPESCLPNLVAEMNAYRLFHQRCRDNNILVLQKNSAYEMQHPYRLPVRFVLRSQATGLETPASADMDALLRMWGC